MHVMDYSRIYNDLFHAVNRPQLSMRYIVQIHVMVVRLADGLRFVFQLGESVLRMGVDLLQQRGLYTSGFVP